MITTGIIREINISSSKYKNNKYKVELNIFQIPGDTNKNSYTYEANCMVASGFSSVYNIGDKVYVGFLNNDKSIPIILGKIYQGLCDDYRGYAALTDLKVKNSVELPNDLIIGSYNYDDLDVSFKKLSLLSIQQVNQLVTLLASTPLTLEHLKEIQAAADAMRNDIEQSAKEMGKEIDQLDDNITAIDDNITTMQKDINDDFNDISEQIEIIKENLAEISDTDLATLHSILNFRGRVKSFDEVSNPRDGDLIIFSEDYSSTIKAGSKWIYIEGDGDADGEWLGISGLGAAVADLQALLIDLESKITQTDTQLKKYTDDQIDGLKVAIETKEGKEHIVIRNAANDEICYVDATAFVKDGMLDSAKYNTETKKLTLTWNTDAGKNATEIEIGDLVDIYTAGDGLKLKDNKFSIDESTVATVENLNVLDERLSDIENLNSNSNFTMNIKFKDGGISSFSIKKGWNWSNLCAYSAFELSDFRFSVINGFIAVTRKDAGNAYRFIKSSNTYVKECDAIMSTTYETEDATVIKLVSEEFSFSIPSGVTWKVLADYLNNDEIIAKSCPFYNYPVRVNIPSDECYFYEVDNFDDELDPLKIQNYEYPSENYKIKDNGRYKLGLLMDCNKGHNYVDGVCMNCGKIEKNE